MFFSLVFLSFFCIFETWLTDLVPPGDVIALRFQLFLSHTYGLVLVMVMPMIAVETLMRLLCPHDTVAHRKASQTVGSDHQHYYKGEVRVEEEEDSNNSDKESFLPHNVSYLCCLTMWVVIALNVRWRWKQEEVWTATCLHTSNSLIRCLPNLFSPMHSAMGPYWGMVFLSLLLFFLITCIDLQRQPQAHAQTERTHTQKNGVNNTGNLIPVLSAPSKPVHPGILVSEPVQTVDPEKTESSCTVHKMYSWNSVQMSACHHGDFVLLSPECLSAERRGQEHERTKRGIPLTFITEEHMNSQCRSLGGWRQRGFPCLGVNVMIGFMGVLSIFVLPLNLSVNISLIQTIERLLEMCIKPLVSLSPYTRITSVSQNATIVWNHTETKGLWG